MSDLLLFEHSHVERIRGNVPVQLGIRPTEQQQHQQPPSRPLEQQHQEQTDMSQRARALERQRERRRNRTEEERDRERQRQREYRQNQSAEQRAARAQKERERRQNRTEEQRAQRAEQERQRVQGQTVEQRAARTEQAQLRARQRTAERTAEQRAERAEQERRRARERTDEQRARRAEQERQRRQERTPEQRGIDIEQTREQRARRQLRGRNRGITVTPENLELTVETLTVGQREYICAGCRAMMYKGEAHKGKLGVNATFSLCCGYGTIRLDSVQPPPEPVQHLYADDTPVAKDFRANIRKYNSALAMASVGVDLGAVFQFIGGGPWVYKLSGHADIPLPRHPIPRTRSPTGLQPTICLRHGE